MGITLITNILQHEFEQSSTLSPSTPYDITWDDSGEQLLNPDGEPVIGTINQLDRTGARINYFLKNTDRETDFYKNLLTEQIPDLNQLDINIACYKPISGGAETIIATTEIDPGHIIGYYLQNGYWVKIEKASNPNPGLYVGDALLATQNDDESWQVATIPGGVLLDNHANGPLADIFDTIEN